ncbi:hypothetical protein F0562_028721 [Nyssa sinensis]|uniref:Dihydroflavonol 4-reductase n=1 Tax=Nyssa sinensis TaxID=561372 RepID=A0A5J5AYY3_9ASTE|nr:hypothetical protein F0562_028721 [Nyssa sinensis]
MSGDEEKNGHLKKLEKAEENLQLFKTDLLDYEGLCAAITGCTGVFHVACPVPSQTTLPNPEARLTLPHPAKVNKVVLVSSVGAVMLNPSWPKDQAMDENCWTDKDYCKTIEMWYCMGKTVAESEALDFAKRNELNIVTVCPSIVIGPMLQSTLNASSLLLLNYLKDGKDSVQDDRNNPIVDVRDVAEALLLAYEKPEAEGRYICSSYMIRARALVEKLKTLFPNYNYPKNFSEAKEGPELSSKKLQNLGWKFRPLEESIVDAVQNFEQSGLLGKD